MELVAYRFGLDLIAFALLALGLMVLLARWVRRRAHGKSFGPAVWGGFIAAIGLSILLALYAERQEHRRLEYTVSGLAPTYAGEMLRAGIARITLDTPENDPLYLELLRRQIRWERDNPAIADIYTFIKRPDGKIALLVDSETDYDRDGRISGAREARTAIGEIYQEDAEMLARAFAGEAVFTPSPIKDRWGVWVSSYVPLRDDAGNVIGVLGVDYPAADWIHSLLWARLVMLGFGVIVAIILAASATITTTLRAEVARRRETESQKELLHRRLIDASRQAGMAEIATGVLHNVGNVLNSVNVSTSLIADRLRGREVEGLVMAAQLLRDHEADLPHFLTADPVGRQLPDYFSAVAELMADNRAQVDKELTELTRGIEHIKEIVRMQQEFSRTSDTRETTSPAQLFDEALAMSGHSPGRHNIEITRDFAPAPSVRLDRHKVLQVLVNLISNALRAVKEQDRPDAPRRITLRLAHDAPRAMLRWDVLDTGVGIPPENLTRIFQHGFTTRPDGHGFGLHSAANAAGEMGGTLSAASDGPGMGACFRLEIPVPAAADPTR